MNVLPLPCLQLTNRKRCYSHHNKLWASVSRGREGGGGGGGSVNYLGKIDRSMLHRNFLRCDVQLSYDDKRFISMVIIIGLNRLDITVFVWMSNKIFIKHRF